jgi:hypothetical protein
MITTEKFGHSCNVITFDPIIVDHCRVWKKEVANGCLWNNKLKAVAAAVQSSWVQRQHIVEFRKTTNSEKQLGTNNSKVVFLGMTTRQIFKLTQTMRGSLQALTT